MKRKILCFLITSLLILNTVPVFASSDSGQTAISLENIKEVMLDNSIEMKIAENNYKQTLQKYEDIKDAVDDIEDEIYSLKAPSDTGSDTYDSEYESYNTKLSNLKSQLSSKEDEEESYKYTVKSAKINYRTTVENKVYSAKKEYVAYLSAVSDLQLMEDQLKSDQKDLELYKKKYEYGFISKKEYDSYSITNTTSNNDYESKKKDVELARNNLCFTLGLDINSDVVFDTNIEDTFNDVLDINYDEDLQEMLSNNYDIKLQEIEIDKLDDSEDSYDSDEVYDYDVDNADLNLESTKTNAELEFKEQYNTLISSYNKLKTTYDVLNQSQIDYNLMKQKNLSGFASDKELSDKKLELDNKTSSFVSDKNNFLLTYLNYLQMKEGY